MTYEVERAYYRWTSRHPDVVIDQQTFDSIYKFASRDSIRITSALSPAVAQLVEYVDWLREREAVA